MFLCFACWEFMVEIVGATRESPDGKGRLKSLP